MSELLVYVTYVNYWKSWQVLWDGEWTTGTGRSTGEETEQVFSYLSRANQVTKHQLPESMTC